MRGAFPATPAQVRSGISRSPHVARVEDYVLSLLSLFKPYVVISLNLSELLTYNCLFLKSLYADVLWSIKLGWLFLGQIDVTSCLTIYLTKISNRIFFYFKVIVTMFWDYADVENSVSYRKHRAPAKMLEIFFHWLSNVQHNIEII